MPKGMFIFPHENKIICKLRKCVCMYNVSLFSPPSIYIHNHYYQPTNLTSNLPACIIVHTYHFYHHHHHLLPQHHQQTTHSVSLSPPVMTLALPHHHHHHHASVIMWCVMVVTGPICCQSTEITVWVGWSSVTRLDYITYSSSVRTHLISSVFTSHLLSPPLTHLHLLIISAPFSYHNLQLVLTFTPPLL